ncbi:hypothetical protein BESB_033530 [Besnoitia besnoiti]|uniref:SRS domain-containing protein n=1 Tax=Besnoitia besnoiti TaxID=94643 RepID=A0A2A9MFV9_BESBE|nr:hypothetical protein BESB_033530 [Besnoitia besnoiti]PFH36895.1 hypothetical protein BESB_033530 [Besnoitia besnoiti]
MAWRLRTCEYFLQALAELQHKELENVPEYPSCNSNVKLLSSAIVYERTTAQFKCEGADGLQPGNDGKKFCMDTACSTTPSLGEDFELDYQSSHEYTLKVEKQPQDSRTLYFFCKNISGRATLRQSRAEAVSEREATCTIQILAVGSTPLDKKTDRNSDHAPRRQHHRRTVTVLFVPLVSILDMHSQELPLGSFRAFGPSALSYSPQSAASHSEKCKNGKDLFLSVTPNKNKVAFSSHTGASASPDSMENAFQDRDVQTEKRLTELETCIADRLTHVYIASALAVPNRAHGKIVSW